MHANSQRAFRLHFKERSDGLDHRNEGFRLLVIHTVIHINLKNILVYYGSLLVLAIIWVRLDVSISFGVMASN